MKLRLSLSGCTWIMHQLSFTYRIPFRSFCPWWTYKTEKMQIDNKIFRDKNIYLVNRSKLLQNAEIKVECLQFKQETVEMPKQILQNASRVDQWGMATLHDQTARYGYTVLGSRSKIKEIFCQTFAEQTPSKALKWLLHFHSCESN